MSLRPTPRRAALVLAVLALALVPLAFGISSGSAGPKKTTYTVGFAAGLTGFLSFFDNPVLQGMKAAVADVNARGLAGKYEMQLDVKDMKSQPAVSATVVQDLLSSGAKFIISACDVDTSLPGSIVAVRAKVPVMSGCAGDSTYRERAGQFAFLNVPGTLAEGAVMAEWAASKGYKKAYLITSKDIGYTQSMGEAFQDRFEQLGGKIVGTSLTHISDTQFRAVATKAVSAKPDVIATTTFVPGTVSLLRDLGRAGNKSPIVMNDGNDAAVIYQAGPQLKLTTMVSFGYFRGKGSVANQFIASFRKIYHQDPPDDSAISGGDAIYEIAAALKKAGTDDPGKIYDTLNGISNVVTVSGITTYRGHDGVPVKPFTIFKIDLAKKQLVQVALHYAKKVPPPRK